MKYKFCILSLLLILSNSVLAQKISTKHICELDEKVSETSGLIIIDNEFWTHNDSGNENKIYRVDTVTGDISRVVVIKNATNKDWEDICKDDNYIYIGDFGNNNGERKDLRIFRTSIDSLKAGKDSLIADTISFYYPEQTKFNWNSYSTNYDCEALISYNDSLFVFTKNWGNKKTYMYKIPSIPGDYPASLIDSIDVDLLVTSASLNNNTLVLSAYSNYIINTYIIIAQDFSNHFFDGNTSKHKTDISLSQTEGIFLKNSEIYLSNEKFQTNPQGLKKANIGDLIRVNYYTDKNLLIFPNPAENRIFIKNCGKYKSYKIFNSRGSNIKTGKINYKNILINTDSLKRGNYIITLSDNKISVSKKIIIK